MKTITNCFLYIAILVVLCFFDILCLGINIRVQDWWGVAMCVVAFVVGVLGIRLCYKRAKSYEETILDAIDNTLDIAVLAHAKALRLETKKILSELEELTKDKKDEVEADK